MVCCGGGGGGVSAVDVRGRAYRSRGRGRWTVIGRVGGTGMRGWGDAHGANQGARTVGPPGVPSWASVCRGWASLIHSYILRL